jgi:hypothetical protein
MVHLSGIDIVIEQTEYTYCANFCEENVWHLADQCQKRGIKSWVVFISNSLRQVAIWQQRSAPVAQPLVWDYHVVLLKQSDPVLLCHDMDSRLAANLPLEDYLRAAFPLADELADDFQPRFKVIDSDDYLSQFSSDRRHMNKEDQWLSPPPAWPCIGEGHNLEAFIDTADSRYGKLYDLTQLLDWAKTLAR